MRVHHGRKLAVAIATTLALCFVFYASPALAAGPFPITITGGSLTAAGNTFSLVADPLNPPPCPLPGHPPKPNTLALNTDTPVAGQWTVTGVFTAYFRLGTPPAGPWYQADITINARGTYAAHPPPVPPDYDLATVGAPNPHLTFQARIYELASNPVTCAKDNLKCIIVGRMAGTGTFTGTLPNAVALDSGTLTASSAPAPPGQNMVTSSCAAPFVAWNGQVVSVTGLAFQV